MPCGHPPLQGCLEGSRRREGSSRKNAPGSWEGLCRPSGRHKPDTKIHGRSVRVLLPCYSGGRRELAATAPSFASVAPTLKAVGVPTETSGLSVEQLFRSDIVQIFNLPTISRVLDVLTKFCHLSSACPAKFADLAQWQSNRFVSDRFRVQVPGSAPRFDFLAEHRLFGGRRTAPPTTLSVKNRKV